MIDDTSFFDSIFRNDTKQFTDTLDMLVLVDIGTIEDIDVNGRATVVLNKVQGRNPIRLKDIEVIYPGNNVSALTISCAGGACLLFAPSSTIPDIQENAVDWSAPSYSKRGIKALPISNGNGALIRANFSSAGSLDIATKDYTLSMDESTVSFGMAGSISKQIDNKGNIYFRRKTENSGLLKASVTDSGVSITSGNVDNTSVYSFDSPSDGSLKITHVKPGSDEDEILNEVVIQDDGSVSITAPGNISLTISKEGDISLATDGKIAVKATSISFNDDHLEIT